MLFFEGCEYFFFRQGGTNNVVNVIKSDKRRMTYKMDCVSVLMCVCCILVLEKRVNRCLLLKGQRKVKEKSSLFMSLLFLHFMAQKVKNLHE